jgi:single-stranded-DNA-specific exonuclease
VRWILPEVSPHADGLARELGVAPFVAKILCGRGMHDPRRRGTFLDPRLAALSDPFLLPDMEAAVGRVLAAIDRGERIVCSGITMSTECLRWRC